MRGDIVKRLRAVQGFPQFSDPNVCDQAADYIVRLRSLAARLAAELETLHGGDQCEDGCSVTDALDAYRQGVA